MRIPAVLRNHRRGLRGSAVLASAATLTMMTAVLATGSPPAQAALSSHLPGASRPAGAGTAPAAGAWAALSGHRSGAATLGAVAQDSWLEGVSAVSPTDAWAAGYYTNSSGVDEPLILRLNGTAWTKAKAPAAPSGAQGSYLDGVSADSATDAWAAGYYTNSSGADEPLVLHWNGTAWKKMKSPTLSGTELHGVSAASATDAWAAGHYQNSSGVQVPLVLHCNATACKQVTSPAPNGGSSFALQGVDVVSAKEAWAAGYYNSSSGVVVPLILHCNATACKRVSSPAPRGAPLTGLFGVSADSAKDAWAAGLTLNSSGVIEPLIQHWNSTAWSRVTGLSPSGTALYGVSAVSPADVWAAGFYVNAGGSGGLKTLMLHGNGTAWTTVTSPTPSGAIDVELTGVSADSAKDTWAAGYYENASGTTYQTLMLHCTGTTCKRVKSPDGA